jgi:hypothetical protein
MPDWWGPIFGAIREGIDPLVVIIMVLCAIIARELHELNRMTAMQTQSLKNMEKKLDQHGAHQTARMEEIRRFMVSWWERFGPRPGRE